MKILSEQITAMTSKRPALQQAWLVDHVLQFFPERCDELGEEALPGAVQQAMARAAEHGFTAPVHVARFVDLVFAFGPRFDADPRYPWAATILSDQALASPEQRIEQLHLSALQHARFDATREGE